MALGFDASFLILLAAGVLGALLRVVCSTRQATLSRETLGDAVAGGVSSQLVLPALGLVPVARDFVAKLDTVADQAILVVFTGYVASHVWTTVARQRVPAWLGKLADRVGPPVLALALLTAAAAPAHAGSISFTHPATVNCAVTSTTALAAPTVYQMPRNVILQNDSDTDIYLNVAGGAAVVNAGVRLNANGGTWTMEPDVPIAAITCIHGGSGTKRLLVTHDHP